MIELQPHMLEGIPQNGPTDPIEYYKRPIIGRLFRERINRGLRKAINEIVVDGILDQEAGR